MQIHFKKHNMIKFNIIFPFRIISKYFNMVNQDQTIVNVEVSFNAVLMDSLPMASQKQLVSVIRT